MVRQPGISVGIIGGGFCGTMCAVHLLKDRNLPVNIFIFNVSTPEARGVAFSTYSPNHLLNVQAGRMSAFEDQPGHFVNWVKEKKYSGEEDISDAYLPRNYFGEYVESIFSEALEKKSPEQHVHIIRETVTDISPEDDGYQIITSAGNKFFVSSAILATGNYQPSPPVSSMPEGIEGITYFPNPWKQDAVNEPGGGTVMIIGAGLTMVDVVLGLMEKKFSGKIIAVSPRGFNILPHKHGPPRSEILQNLEKANDLRSLVSIFKDHVRIAKSEGDPGEWVVDAVRARTQEIWQSLSIHDKKTFMSHLRHLWGVARHRLPVEIHRQISDLIGNGRLKIMAGRIISVNKSEGKLRISVQQRGHTDHANFEVSRLINCTGPEADINKQGALYRNLIARKLVEPDDMRLGIKATADGVILSEGNPCPGRFFAVGSLLKGILWESTAVPELRVQAKKIAGQILRELPAAID